MTKRETIRKFFDDRDREVPPRKATRMVELEVDEEGRVLSSKISLPALEGRKKKAAEPIRPSGKPLRRWGRRNVPITREDVAKAIAEWDTDVPVAARGLLMAETLTEEEEAEITE